MDVRSEIIVRHKISMELTLSEVKDLLADIEQVNKKRNDKSVWVELVHVLEQIVEDEDV